MMQKIQDRKNEEGFTLIELLIVIVILGILAAIVVFSVNGITDTGTSSACKADLKTVESASEAYRAQNGAYAATGGALVPNFIREYPSSTSYTIVYGSGGSVSATHGTPAVAGCP
jgi:general secretion pathway protein G